MKTLFQTPPSRHVPALPGKQCLFNSVFKPLLCKRLSAAAILLLLFIIPSLADWPTHRNDALRTGYPPSTLSSNITLRWTHQTTPPQPAWPRSARMQFDRVAQPVIANALLFFGGSGDHTLHALNTDTGSEHWRFITDGPIRFAPTVWKDHLFLGSDDGNLYCLNAKTGTLIWKDAAAPTTARSSATDI